MRSFSWGDTVQVKAEAVSKGHSCGPLKAWVCGIREVNNESQAHQFGAPVGSKIYLVEFEDGSSLELAEEWIEPFEPL